MKEQNEDKTLDDVILNDATSKRLVQKNGDIKVPGTPIILPGRGVEPKEQEYVDVNSNNAVSSDPNRIAVLKAKNSKEVIENQLLGSFAGNGVYQVSEEIGSELLQMVKQISNQDEFYPQPTQDIEGEKVRLVPGLFYCQSVSTFNGLGIFKFAVQTYYQKPFAVSELFLLEDIKKADGFVLNVNVYSVAKYKDVFSYSYKHKMFQYFNIVSKEIAIKMNEEEKLLFGWAYRRKLYFKQLLLLGNYKYLLVEANYFQAKIQALSSMGAFGTAVLSSFNELKIKAENLIGKELTSRDVNDLLDMTVDEFSSKYPEMFKQYNATIVADTKTFQAEIKIISESNSSLAKENVKKIAKTYIYEHPAAKPNSALKVYVDKGIQPRTSKKKPNSNSVNKKTNTNHPTIKPPAVEKEQENFIGTMEERVNSLKKKTSQNKTKTNHFNYESN